MSDIIIKKFFTTILDIKMYHWNTKVYARHKATDEYFSKLLSSIDEFVEVYIGKYKRPSVKPFSISVNVYNDKDVVTLLKNFCAFLTKDMPKMLSNTDTDLLNIRDTMLADTNQTLYLFTLN